MSELRVTPPLGAEQPDGDSTCNYGPDAALCGAPAAHHVIWTADGENSFACDKHMTEACERWVPYDSHPFGGVCGMPISHIVWSWEEPPGRCGWEVDDDTLALAVAAEQSAPEFAMSLPAPTPDP